MGIKKPHNGGWIMNHGFSNQSQKNHEPNRFVKLKKAFRHIHYASQLRIPSIRLVYAGDSFGI